MDVSPTKPSRRRPKRWRDNGRKGVGVDVFSEPAFDPSENVKALSEAASKRQDDLRNASKELTDAKLEHLKEIGTLRAGYQEAIGKSREEYQEKISHAESGRLDSIRQVDREEVAKTAVAANTAITTLAKQTTDLATTLQKQVADTAQAAEARNSATYTDVNKRLSALELSSSEGKGKQTVVDPQMDKLTILVETLARNQAMGTGKQEGSSAVWIGLTAVAGLVLTALAIGLPLVMRGESTAAPVAPQVVYLPAPAAAAPVTLTPGAVGAVPLAVPRP